MTPELQNRLSALADKLGVSVEHVWSVLVRQAYIDGLSSLLRAALAFAVVTAAVAGYAVWFRRAPNVGREASSTFAARVTGALVAAMLLLVSGDILCNSLINALTDFLNPEYFALRHLPFTN